MLSTLRLLRLCVTQAPCKKSKRKHSRHEAPGKELAWFMMRLRMSKMARPFPELMLIIKADHDSFSYFHRIHDMIFAGARKM